ncbi:MAG: hypothetical protein LBS99_00325 [Clostridiales bacterium]|jgi:hypothetical protein|nr:hypothetical protein [Clostridiales bacterium]
MIFLATGIRGNGLDALEGCAPDMRYSFYISGAAEVSGASSVSNGAGTIVSCDIKDAARVRQRLKTVDGESVTFGGSASDLNIIVKKFSADIIRREDIGGILIYYCFSPALGNGLNLDGAEINMQLAYSNGRVTAGTPLILGSY